MSFNYALKDFCPLVPSIFASHLNTEIPDAALWDSFGVCLKPGMGNNYFLFLTENPVSLFENVGLLSIKQREAVLASDDFTGVSLPKDCGKLIDDFLHFYFFGSSLNVVLQNFEEELEIGQTFVNPI
jgi:hypothetical protein